MTSYRARADQVIEGAVRNFEADCQRIFAEQSKAGMLGSGTTLTRSIKAYGERLHEAVQASSDEIANSHNGRGTQWRNLISDLQNSVDAEVARFDSRFENALRLSRARGSASEDCRRQVDEIGNRLTQEISAFRDGWAAPRPEHWSKRVPVRGAITVAVTAAILGWAFDFI